MADELLPCVEIEPPVAATRSVIWLHGLGASGHDFEPIVPHLGLDPDLPTRFVFPHAPQQAVTINAGMIMPAWYDIRSPSLKRDADETGVRDSARRIVALISREQERGIPPQRIVLAGFSQGGAMALHVALRHPQRLAGALILSAYMVCSDSVEAERSEANRGLAVFQAHGTADPMVPLEAAERTRDRLIELGYPLDWRTYTMGHEVHPMEIIDIGNALRSMLSTPD